ncbi:hypothetical protein FS842_002160 [Serendipita sp. 407]|nr:hypothetical protein FS842_002160 [Serendipita sp. 407]
MSTGLLFSRDDLVFYIFPTHRHADVEKLKELIRDYGGDVCDYHRLQSDDERLGRSEGVALIDPTQLYAPKLLRKREKVDPDGEVVLTYLNWGYAQLCVDQNELIHYDVARRALVFCRGSWPDGSWRFYFSEKLGQEKEHFQKTVRRIQKYGGSVVFTEDIADVFIAPDDPTLLLAARNRFEWDPQTRVETESWLFECVDQGYVKFTSPPVRRMPGRRPGSRRVEFTPEDDKHLVTYIANKGREDGQGLQGIGFYTRLYNSGLEWAKRHPPDSWRGRYGNNREEFNARIERYRARHPEIHRDNYGRDNRTRFQNTLDRYLSSTQRNLQHSKDTHAQDKTGEGQVTRQFNEEEDEEHFPPRRRRRSDQRRKAVVHSEDEQDIGDMERTAGVADNIQEYGHGSTPGRFWLIALI